MRRRLCLSIFAALVAAALVAEPPPVLAEGLFKKATRALKGATGKIVKEAAKALEKSIVVVTPHGVVVVVRKAPAKGSYGVKTKQGAGIGISVAEGPPGTEVTVDASGLPPNAAVTVGVGPKPDETDGLAGGHASDNGDFSATVAVPEDAEVGAKLVFVVETDDDKARLVSGPFRITEAAEKETQSASADDGGGADEPPANGQGAQRGKSGQGDQVAATATISVTGVLSREGVECPALHGDDGKLYTLTPRVLGPYLAGDRVKVEGRVAEVSVCMQGITIAVTKISPAE